ncbi:hypothetical protein [Sanyastnella coralliicola]|uniref:hypothetical protein n=1 Tax=Sanyastnella coralliicola TaxID=3069118 RepID=UPI0027BA199E|nr:hypothetical protein [Longitalea sp. SCSIO 12813]
MTGDKNTYTIELLIDYALGLTTAEGTKRVNEILATDEEAQAHLHTIKEMLASGMEPEELIEMIQPKAEVSKEVKKSSPSWIWAAAGIAVFLVAGYLLFALQPNFDDMMAEAVSEKYPAAVVRGEEDAKAHEAYAQGNYELARTLFQSSTSENPEDRFYSALSAMYNSQYAEAFNEFGDLAYEDHAYKRASYWYGSICAIEIDSCVHAQNYLAYLARNQGYKNDEARALYKALSYEPCTQKDEGDKN